MKILRGLLFVIAGVGISLGAVPADPSLVLNLPFEEGSGPLAVDCSPNGLEADLSNVQWATGAFGTALHFGGTNAFIDLPAVPGLNGATQFTLSVWATWEDLSPRRYPNLLTSQTWSPGGLMLFVSDNTCSFRLGRPGERAGVPGNKWTETGASLLNVLPQRQWTHLCVTFNLPHLTTYVNGKPVSRVSWPYPVEAKDLRLGGWFGSVCHNGLLDDLRIYSRALCETEVVNLADASTRVSAIYTLADKSKSAQPLIATFKNRHATLAIDKHGQAVSLRNRTTGRELLAAPQPFVSVRLKDGRQLSARTVTRKGDTLTFSFARNEGSAVIDVDTHRDFFTFTVRSLSLTNAASLTFCTLPVGVTTHRGNMANMLSDDSDAVCLRGYDLPVEMDITGNSLRVWTTEKYGLTGWRAGLAAGPKSEMPAMLRAMAEQSGEPYSKLGGPWSLDAEATRGSSLFAGLYYPSTDDSLET
ncbi:MAG: LamG domain-containing protein, partial [bacterium]